MLRFFSILAVFFCLTAPAVAEVHPLDKMPLVNSGQYSGEAPIEQRGPQWAKYLAASVKIQCPDCSGSGTIIYYDEKTNTAWVATCGHLWNGHMNGDEGRQRNVACKVVTWYHNEQKLAEPKSYPARVHFYMSGGGGDTGLVSFQPDWKPEYFPIAPLDYKIEPGTRLHSCGCDGGREVAHYDVRVTGYSGNNLNTVENSPRPGRSGGGLMSDDGYYVATCWGTSSYSGNGEGYFTRLSLIHSMWNQFGYGFLLNIEPALARKIPVIDRNSPQGNYPKEYILLPRKK